MDYVKPTLTVVGGVREVTLAGGRGARLDEDYPCGTPYGDLTFSG